MEAGANERVNLQIWRSVGAGEYTSVTEVVYTKTVADERIASVPVSMSVMTGDMVGFYVPGGQLATSRFTWCWPDHVHYWWRSYFIPEYPWLCCWTISVHLSCIW